mgnify:CR=1 FL=1
MSDDQKDSQQKFSDLEIFALFFSMILGAMILFGPSTFWFRFSTWCGCILLSSLCGFIALINWYTKPYYKESIIIFLIWFVNLIMQSFDLLRRLS